jgi:hypothetical protein
VLLDYVAVPFHALQEKYLIDLVFEWRAPKVPNYYYIDKYEMD